MKTFGSIFLLLVIISNTQAQEFQGKAIYQFFNNYSNVDWSKKNMGDADVAKWKSKLTKESQKAFELVFTLKELSWSEVNALGTDGKKAKSTEWGKPIKKLLYKNFDTQRYLIESELFDKAFLVDGELELPSWELTGETKTIGAYSAQKAIWQIEESVKSFGSDTPQMQIRVIVAWFTTDIPVPQGPGKFWGLPGLILELQNGPLTYICDKVILNPAEEIKIKKPKNGERVTQAALDKIAIDKMEEITKRYNKTGKKG